ncbi:TPA: acyltransferase [Vibrio vulnificus]|nr:acyltransferase [Vibrio vulnificus]
MIKLLIKFLKRLLPLKYRVKVGKNFTSNGRVLLIDNGKVLIGDNVRINSSTRSNPVYGVGKTILVCQYNAHLIIGNDVGISNAQIYCEKEITIGDRTLIGAGVKMWDLDFHSIKIIDRKKSDDRGVSKPISIGSDCFIGAGSIITKGVVLGDGTVIGAGSVVTKSTGVNELWAGNPAKFVRYID